MKLIFSISSSTFFCITDIVFIVYGYAEHSDYLVHSGVTALILSMEVTVLLFAFVTSI